jgi:hypothetical protein
MSAAIVFLFFFLLGIDFHKRFWLEQMKKPTPKNVFFVVREEKQ